MEDIIKLNEKYIKAKTDKERRKIKREVHANSKGAKNGTLVAHGRLKKRRQYNGPNPKWTGCIEDINTGKLYNAVVWNNGDNLRIEICKDEDVLPFQ